jgi:hypothetical protein
VSHWPGRSNCTGLHEALRFSDPAEIAMFDDMPVRLGGHADQQQKDRTGGRGMHARHRDIDKPFKDIGHD